jgi:hypothetical protein
MKTRIISVIAAFGIIAGLSTSASAAGVMDFAKQAAEKGSGFFCRKANIWDFTLSVRSGSGTACKSKLVGALAVYLCLEGNMDKFDESGCFKNAKEALKGDLLKEDKTVAELDTAKAKEILIEEGKKSGGAAFEFIKKIVAGK